MTALPKDTLDELVESWSAHASPARKFGDALYFARKLEAERDLLRAQIAEMVEALSIIAGEPRQDDTYAGMDKVEIARSALAKHRHD